MTESLAIILSGLIGGVLAAIMTAVFTRYVERSRNTENFRVLLIQKRVDTALRIQGSLQGIASQFLTDIEAINDTNKLRDNFIGVRRKIVSLVEETAFTNILIYGYVSGLVYSGILHDLDLNLKPTDFKNDLRRRINFILAGYSLSLARSTLEFWSLDTDVGDFSVVQSWAKLDSSNWQNAGKSFHKFTSFIQQNSNKKLIAAIKKQRKAMVTFQSKTG
jgi:hypothetical protein